MKNNIEGVGVALVTPFHPDGNIDYASLERLVDHVIEGGVNYLVALGTTAETPTLTKEEKHSVITCIKRKNAGRLPLIIGIGGNSTSEVVGCVNETDLEGVSAVLSVTPYYNKPTQEGLFEHYKAVAGASPVPVMLYNVPARTGINMEAETTLKLAREVDNIMGIKEACGHIPQMMKLLRERPCGFKVISGDDCMALPLIAIGGDGIISVAANAYPKVFTQMTAFAFSGDRRNAAENHMRLTGTFEALFREGNPAGVKTALENKGIIASRQVRLPLVKGSEDLKRTLSALDERENI